MATLTKRAADVFNPLAAGGAPRGADMAEARTWGDEIESLIPFSLDAPGDLPAIAMAGGATHVIAGGVVFVLDPADTTSAHDGINVLVSSDGLRFKPSTAVAGLTRAIIQPSEDVKTLFGYGARRDDAAGLNTVWIEFDALLQPGILTLRTQGGAIAVRSAAMLEHLLAYYNLGCRRFVVSYVSYQGRTYTTWATPPTNPTGTPYRFWREDVFAPLLANVDNFDPLEAVVLFLGKLEGVEIVLPFDRHDDVELLNDEAAVFAGGADPMRFGRTVVTRRNEEIARCASDIAQFVARFGRHNIAMYCAHEAAHIQASVPLFSALADLAHARGLAFHVSCADPVDRSLGIVNTLADAINAWKADVIWVQPSVGYGYNHAAPGLSAFTYAHHITVFGVANYMRTWWRPLIDLARSRPTGGQCGLLGVNIETWRRGLPGVGTLTFAATTGTNVIVTLGTASSVTSAHIGRVINTRIGQLQGRATVTAIDSATQIRVNIIENLANVSVGSGLWAIEPGTVNYESYPAPIADVLVEVQAVAAHVELMSLYSAGYAYSSAFNLIPDEANGGVPNFRARAYGQWTGLSRGMLDASGSERFLQWSGRGLFDPDGQRLLVWDNGDGAAGDGRLDWAQLGAGLALAGGALAVDGFVGETAYTPNVVASTGSITTLGARTGWSIRIGKMRLAIADVTITTNGTGGGAVNVSLPSTANRVAVAIAKEIALGNNAIAGHVLAGGSSVALHTAAGAYPGANGSRFLVFVAYLEA